MDDVTRQQLDAAIRAAFVRAGIVKSVYAYEDTERMNIQFCVPADDGNDLPGNPNGLIEALFAAYECWRMENADLTERVGGPCGKFQVTGDHMDEMTQKQLDADIRAAFERAGVEKRMYAYEDDDGGTHIVFTLPTDTAGNELPSDPDGLIEALHAAHQLWRIENPELEETGSEETELYGGDGEDD